MPTSLRPVPGAIVQLQSKPRGRIRATGGQETGNDLAELPPYRRAWLFARRWSHSIPAHRRDHTVSHQRGLPKREPSRKRKYHSPALSGNTMVRRVPSLEAHHRSRSCDRGKPLRGRKHTPETQIQPVAYSVRVATGSR